MADDLVAELILRLQNEMSGGIEDIKAEFDSLNAPLGELKGSLDELSGALAELQPPAALSDGMAGVVGETDDAITAMQNLGAAIEDDVTKVQALKDAYSGVGVVGGGGPPEGTGLDGIVTGGGGGGGASDDETAGGSGHGGGGHGPASDVLSSGLFAAIEFGTGIEAAKSYADFDWILTHAAITEKLSGQAADDEKARLAAMLDSLALGTGTSSTDLADSYYWLLTTGMDHRLLQQMMPLMAETATAYNVPMMDQAQSVFALNRSYGLGPDDMEMGLAMLAQAAKIGHFTVADFGTDLPRIGAQMNMLGVTGLRGVDVTSAALEVIRGNTTDSAQAQTDLYDLLQYITSPTFARFADRTARSKDLLGKPLLDLLEKYDVPVVDIPAYFNKEAKEGVDPLDAAIDFANSLYRPGMSDTDKKFIYQTLFHGVDSGNAALALAENYDLFHQDQAKIASQSSPRQVQTDFNTASNSPEYQMRIFNEEMVQLERTLGQAVIPALHAVGNDAYFAAVGLQQIGAWWQEFSDKIAGPAIGTAAAIVQHNIDTHQVSQGERDFFNAYKYRGHEPIRLEITLPPGVTAMPKNVPPGTSVRVDQGRVLGAP